MRGECHVALLSEKINTISNTVERNRPLGTARFRLDANIKIDIEDIGGENIDLNSSSYGHRPVVSSPEHSHVRSVRIKFWEFLDQLFK